LVTHQDKSDTRVASWITTRELDARGSGSAAASDLDVVAMGVELWQSLQTWVEGLSVAVQGEQLGTKNISPRLNIGWNLELDLIAILDDFFVCPETYICSRLASLLCKLEWNTRPSTYV
jgi:hypothetical protein